jgi:hypothetical protein
VAAGIILHWWCSLNPVFHFLDPSPEQGRMEACGKLSHNFVLLLFKPVRVKVNLMTLCGGAL